MIERVLVAKYVCGKSVLQGVLLAVVAKVANLISDYLVIVLGRSGCKFGDRKGSWLQLFQGMYVGNQLYQRCWLQWLQKLPIEYLTI